MTRLVASRFPRPPRAAQQRAAAELRRWRRMPPPPRMFLPLCWQMHFKARAAAQRRGFGLFGWRRQFDIGERIARREESAA